MKFVSIVCPRAQNKHYAGNVGELPRFGDGRIMCSSVEVFTIQIANARIGKECLPTSGRYLHNFRKLWSHFNSLTHFSELCFAPYFITCCMFRFVSTGKKSYVNSNKGKQSVSGARILLLVCSSSYSHDDDDYDDDDCDAISRGVAWHNERVSWLTALCAERRKHAAWPGWLTRESITTKIIRSFFISPFLK